MNAGTDSEGPGIPRRHYDETYKRRAVDLTFRGDRTIKTVARELGVAESMLYEWRRRYGPHRGPPAATPQSLEEATTEIVRLREELARMRERELILKKSLGILSSAPESGMPKSKR